MKKRPDPINRDMGTKRACIAALRTIIAQATALLDVSAIHSALFTLEQGCAEIRKQLPKEKIAKPLKK